MHEVVIARVRVYEVALPLRVAFTISGGSMSVRRSLIIELVDRSGACGYGESAPFEFPFYSAETISSVKACLRETLLPRVVGREIRKPEALLELLTDGVRGNRMARSRWVAGPSSACGPCRPTLMSAPSSSWTGSWA